MEITKGMKHTLKEITCYLKVKGVPKQMIEEIRMHLAYDAVTQGKAVQYDRIYTAVAIVLRKAFGFGPQRILKGLRCFDETVGSVLEPDADWTDLMDWLRDETGIIVRTDAEDRVVVEALTDEERKNNRYGNNKEAQGKDEG